MIRYLAAFAVVTMLVACNKSDPDNAPASDANLPVAGTGRAASMSGQQAYELVCAGCHDEGINGAPRTGEPAEWAGRSSLWQAVLFEHANDGYLEMPAKGGDASLDDATVAKAAEYMLQLTFPETLRD